MAQLLPTPEDPAPRRPRRVAWSAAVVFAMLLVTLVFMLFRANDAREAAEQAERRSYDILVASAQFDAAVAHAEAALATFVVSGDRSVGTRYFDQWIKAGRLLERLEILGRTDPRERQLLKELRVAFATRGKELSRPAALATYERKWAAYNALTEDGELQTARRMRVIIGKLGTAERQRLAARRLRARNITDWSNMLDSLMASLGVLLATGIGLIGWMAFRAVAARADSDRRAAEESQRATELEAAVAARTTELVDANVRLRSEVEERAAAEAQLAQMQKMEAVGQLSGGIAHDFNNMLAVVVGGLDLARRKLETDAQEIGRHIEQALDGATRASALTRRLLTFARAQPLSSEALDPNALIHGMAELLDRTLGELIEIDIRLTPECWPVFTDASQLENAILNLGVNARDAMPNGGQLTIETANRALTVETRLSHGALAAGDYVVVRVRDTGCGMTPEIIQRVFEPFFTTKDVGKGTGLGLSQVFGFIKQSDGGIDIQSAPDVGTTISLFLPRSLAAPDTREEAGDMPVASDTSGRVLVVEDDPRVRASTVTALRHLGYQISEAGDGAAALTLLAERQDIRIVLTDVIMPGMNGAELACKLRQVRPDITVLFTTGYAGDAAVDLVGEGPILQKPFTVARLERALQDAVSRAAA